MSPNSFPHVYKSDTALAESLYLATVQDILALKISAKLVVLSGGWSTFDGRATKVGHSLPSALLLSGLYTRNFQLF